MGMQNLRHSLWLAINRNWANKKLPNQHNGAFHKPRLLVIPVNKMEEPYINPTWLGLSLEVSVPALFPIMGFENQLTPPVVNFKFSTYSFYGVQGAEKIIFTIVIGRKTRREGHNTTTIEFYIFLHTAAATQTIAYD